MIIIIKKLLYLLSSHEKKRAILLMFMIIIMALIDTIGVASILPFIAVLVNPDLVETNIILYNLFQIFGLVGVETVREFLFALGIAVFILLIFSLIFKSLIIYAQSRFIEMRQYSIAKRLIEIYLHQPYSWFLNHHSADLGKNILSEIDYVVKGGLKPFLEIVSRSFVIISLVSLLFVANPIIASITCLLLGGTYCLIFLFIRGYLNQLGEKRVNSNKLRFLAITEVFGAVKEVKVAGLEKVYIKRFIDPAQIFARTNASTAVISQLPRFVLEATAFGGMLLIILFMMSQTGSFNETLPLISLYAYAGYRLMPALQQIYSYFIELRLVGPSLDILSEDIKNFDTPNMNYQQNKIFIKKDIILKNVNFRYPNTSRITLKNLNITIPSKTTVGIIGTTGSGKTTTVDIILGLLKPQEGYLKIDGNLITDHNIRSWQKSIGYVPQQIYLSDDTIAANIAFGEDPKTIDYSKVEKVSKIANLHNFVIEELPNNYHTNIGERGVRLSGGQRQRIGIARALYHNPQVLILDEATSSLDNQTEKAVMEAVDNLRMEITIIIIAHRLSTVKNCNNIFVLEKGELINQGTFGELNLK